MVNVYLRYLKTEKTVGLLTSIYRKQNAKKKNGEKMINDNDDNE